MNCKPGDLAIVINTPIGSPIPNGAIVTCLNFFPGPHLVMDIFGRRGILIDVWAVDWNGKVHGRSGHKLGVSDICLLPIRDPGEDAQDETLSWLPVPHRDEVPA
jgi:hypothetical protein